MPIQPSPKNSRRPDQTKGLRLDVRLLHDANYFVYPVQAITVINCDPEARYTDVPLHRQPIGRRGHDVVLSGTYRRLMPEQGGIVPMGAVMRNGGLDTAGARAAAARGAMATLRDGTIVIGRASGSTLEAIQDQFGQPKNPVVQFMGGGGLLIEEGRRVSQQDLLLSQRFHGKPGGFQASQMQVGQHAILGIRKGQCFAIAAFNKNARSIQDDLFQSGFGSVVKFSRGGSFFLNDGKHRVDGRNNVGFGLKLQRDPDP